MASAPRWIKDELTFGQVRDRIESRDDCEFESKPVGQKVGGRFVRTLADGKKRRSYPFMADKYEWKIDPRTVAKWASDLDIPAEDLGVDDPWR